jgi:hypothetical protein
VLAAFHQCGTCIPDTCATAALGGGFACDTDDRHPICSTSVLEPQEAIWDSRISDVSTRSNAVMQDVRASWSPARATAAITARGRPLRRAHTTCPEENTTTINARAVILIASIDVARGAAHTFTLRLLLVPAPLTLAPATALGQLLTMSFSMRLAVFAESATTM